MVLEDRTAQGSRAASYPNMEACQSMRLENIDSADMDGLK